MQPINKKMNTLFFKVASIVVFILLLFSKVQAFEEDYIVIASASPFKGGVGVYGEQVRRGINFAVKKINASGGLGGKKIKILSYDDACDPKEAEKVAQMIVGSDGKASKEKVLMVVGHTCTASTLMAASTYANADLLHFVPSYLDNLGELASKKIFVMGANVERRAIAATNFLEKNYQNSRVAVLYDDNKSSEQIADFVNKNLGKIADKEPYYASFVSGIDDYTGLIETLSKNAIEVVYLATSLYDAQKIINQMNGKNFKAVYLSSNPMFGDGLFNPEFDGKIFFSFMPDARYTSSAASAVSRFRVEGFEPEGLTLYGLAIVEVFAKAYEKAKDKSIKNIAEVLKNNEFETTVGKIGFNLFGEITGVLPTVYEWIDNSFTEVADNFEN